MLCSASELRRFVAAALCGFGAEPGAAESAAACLIDADLGGHETHGISNFVSHLHYAPGLADGTVAARPEIEVVRTSGQTLVLDAHGGFGPMVAADAISRAVSRAREGGVATVVVRNGCHFGAAGYFASMAARAGTIGLVMCPTGATTIAPGGRDRVIGSNPIAVAAPTGSGDPFVLDMSTTVAAGTKLAIARRDGTAIPLGWAVDAEGELTTDAQAAASGATVPLGFLEGAGHKGFGLGLVVDILGGLLSGTGASAFASYGPNWRQGYFVTVWDVAHFLEADAFVERIDELLDHIRASRPRAEGEPVQIPGDRQARLRAHRENHGVPVSEIVLARCDELADSMSVARVSRLVARPD